jgi:hypothetical protein
LPFSIAFFAIFGGLLMPNLGSRSQIDAVYVPHGGTSHSTLRNERRFLWLR